MFSSQGTYATRALRDIGPFLRYMESEFNIKVSNKVADEFLLVLSESKGMWNVPLLSWLAVDTFGTLMLRCGTTTRAGTPWRPSWTWPTTPSSGPSCRPPPTLWSTASPPSTTRWTSPRSSCPRSPCEWPRRPAPPQPASLRSYCEAVDWGWSCMAGCCVGRFGLNWN